jgi:hypothetical protein
MVSKSQIETRAELEKEGWTRQFTVDEPRLSEAIELYKSLGFEVHLEPMVPDKNSEECAACFKVMCGRYKTIYTRPAEGGDSEDTNPCEGLAATSRSKASSPTENRPIARAIRNLRKGEKGRVMK